jgi:hypothetical protein
MNTEHAQSASDDPPSVEGEFVGRHYNGDPSETMEDLIQAMTRYMNENPKKTAIIVTAGVTAAITAALTAAVATTAIILIGDLADRWIGPKD